MLQGRYKSILVDKEAYLRELCRYVVLNPLRAGMVASVEDWHWSSYLPTAGRMPCPPRLNTAAASVGFGHIYISRSDSYEVEKFDLIHTLGVQNG